MRLLSNVAQSASNDLPEFHHDGVLKRERRFSLVVKVMFGFLEKRAPSGILFHTGIKGFSVVVCVSLAELNKLFQR